MFNNTPFLSGNGSIYVDAGQYSYFINANGWSSLSALFVSVGSDSTPMLGLSDGLLYGKTSFISNDFYAMYSINKSNIIAISLPECKSVIANLFSSCSLLTTVSLPVCEYIKDNVFLNCVSLTSVNTGCISVGKLAFAYCSSLVDVSMPYCEYIDQYAFRNCTSLTTISLPMCSYIGSYAFSHANINNLSLSNCSFINQYAFGENYNLSYVNLSICSVLSQYAFYNCSSLTTVILGYSSIVSINNTVFQNDNNLSEIYVPASLVDAYKSAQYWSSYSNKIFPIPEP